ncbi:TPA: hypothetical protein DIS56_01710 [Candidatus Saccharibacteria bacterium]|nr:MAG: hypothetical protein UX30_C0007G0061 [Candidatus Saccharibacteria bacterium GW2011_GWA2_46_10]OGL35556.1 MAG: hypothetical protein A3F05_00495 [Candidatus Saccharibacteria bacterium RIFCSPHIGHO2_12_FULL_47_17]HCM51828.1 hypothetical protein [Candidatus Saccharibacteria bacterium]
MTEAEKFKSLIESSERTLITSHISPDPDAVCSVMLLGQTLRKNFPNKQIQMALEENIPQDLSFLKGYSEIKFGPLLKTASELKPDLIVIVDAADISRLSRNQNQELERLIHDELKAKIAVVDHHQADDNFKIDGRIDVNIIEDKPATAQQIYELCFEQLNLAKPDGYAETALLGILRDTSRFKYDNSDHKNTFRIASELLDAGASIEQLEYRLSRFNKEELMVLAHLLGNVTDSKQGYTYSFIDDQFASDWKTAGRPDTALKTGCDIFSNQYLRNLNSNFWGFVIYPELLAEAISYSVSFRAVSGGVDVAAIAARLGGGGHKEAAGAKNIQANDISGAIEIIKKAIAESLAA